jgi:hypothetical protein
MSIYCVTGKLGSGKTLACVGRIRDALLAGKKVVTNLDLTLSEMLPHNLPAVNVLRVPDKPSLEDLTFAGRGQDSPDESKNGLIVLDELGAWFNSRGWQDKSRQGVIDWLLHSRKLGWDVYLIIQHPKMLDAQAREGLVEFLVTCRRLDRLRLPFIGGLIKTLTGVLVTLPKVHIGTVRYGMEKEALVADRWVYRAKELYSSYDTRQIFTEKRFHPFFLSWSPVPKKTLREHFEIFLDGSPGRKPDFLHKPKHPLVARIMKLPIEQRFAFYQRFSACGAFDRGVYA